VTLSACGLLLLVSVPLACHGPPPDVKADGRAESAPSGRPPQESDARQPSAVAFRDVKVFDGKSDKRIERTTVLVVGNRIEKIGGAIAIPENATVIDGGGRTLMPGLIDAHAHITGLSLTPKNIANPAADIAIASANYLRNCLMDGYTTIREAGGADHATARLLAEGQIIGPRLYYSGRALTQTGGGADFRTPDEETDPCGHVGPFSVMSVITDGTAAVRKAAREELRRGATQIKLFASGGVVFPAEGHATRYEFTPEELRAAVEERRLGTWPKRP